jgi:hypothetical protein
MHPGACRIAPPSSSRPATAPLSDSSSLLSQLIAHSSFGGAASSRHRLTGTLFGYRDGRVSLSLQQNARCQPTLIVELALPTHALLRELGAHAGARIVLEVEKRAEQSGDAGRLPPGLLSSSIRARHSGLHLLTSIIHAYIHICIICIVRSKKIARICYTRERLLIERQNAMVRYGLFGHLVPCIHVLQ